MVVSNRARANGAGVLVVVAALVGLLVAPAVAQDAPRTPVESAQAAFATAGADVVELTTLVTTLHDERAALEAERSSLSAAQQQLARDEQSAEALARRYMVQAYITGNSIQL